MKHKIGSPPPPQDCLYIPATELPGMSPGSVPRPVRHLNHVMKRFPETGQKVNQFRQEGLFGHGPDWPGWCFLPPACFGIIVEDALGKTASEQDILVAMPVLATLATWRYSQSIYRLDPFFMGEIIGTPLLGEMPAERFLQLPEWCIYVETPGMEWFDEPLHGFWAHLAWNIETHAQTLTFLLDKEDELKMCLLDIGPWSIREGVQKAFNFSGESSHLRNEPDWVRFIDIGQVTKALTPLAAIVLYLCSESPEIEHERVPGQRPAYPRAQKTRHGWKWFPPAEPTVWRVGKTAGALLRQAAEPNAGSP